MTDLTIDQYIKHYYANNTLPIEVWIGHAMDEYGKQCFEAAREKEVDYDHACCVSKFKDYEDYLKSLEEEQK